MELQNKLLKKIRNEWIESFINRSNELILEPDTNLFINLNNVESDLELKCKILERCSRAAYKTSPYFNKRKDSIYQENNREHINNTLSTDFTKKEMESIYTKLGNCINHKKTIALINSGYDLEILNKDTEEK